MESALATGNLSTAWIAEVVERFIYRQIPAGCQVGTSARAANAHRGRKKEYD
jgi:hypothetical protein